MKTTLRFLALLALVATTLTSCGKEPTSPTPAASKAPAVPSASSMTFDLGFFKSHGAAQLAAAHPNGVDATDAKSNWINAVVRVTYINLTVADMLSAPTQALHAALSDVHEDLRGDIDWEVQ